MAPTILRIAGYAICGIFAVVLTWQEVSPSAIACKNLGGRYFLWGDECVKTVVTTTRIDPFR